MSQRGQTSSGLQPAPLAPKADPTNTGQQWGWGEGAAQTGPPHEEPGALEPERLGLSSKPIS